MKLNTKKGGIELHADEKRALLKADALLRAIAKHGTPIMCKQAEGALESLAWMIPTLMDASDIAKFKDSEAA